jgi:hypothetical protein
MQVANTEKTDEKADAAPRKREISKAEQDKIDARRQVRFLDDALFSNWS